MVVLRNAGRSFRWPLVLWCGVLCALVTATNAYEASGQGESTYEEYDDEGPYHRPFELPDTDNDDLEDFDDERGPVDEVLDPITDDDISYSGYYDEDGLDLASASRESHGGHASVSGDLDPLRSVSDDQRGPSNLSSEVGVREFVPSVTESSVNPTTETISRAREDAGQTLGINATTSIVAVGVETMTTTTETPSTVGPPKVTSCAGHQKLSEQPEYVGPSVNFIRKCCPHGQRLVFERSILVSCRKESEIATTTEAIYPEIRDEPRTGHDALGAIVAKFYDGCIEDLEEDVRLGFSFGNPCSTERGLVSFGARTNDTLYVIQNGSLLVIYGKIEDYDIFDTYCLDYDTVYGSLVGYVCPAEVNLRMDIVTSQLFALNLCLVFAIPLLLATAALYMIIPDLRDLHGKALAMNCVNFAIALLLESFFQHRTRGKRMNPDEMVLENYAEYFILATFFWLLVNSANNCFHAWFCTPKDKNVTNRWENRRFLGFALLAQLLPLWIILQFSTTPEGNPAIKHYFFQTIMVVLILTLACLIVCYMGLRRVKNLFEFYYQVHKRLLEKGQDFVEEQIGTIRIPAKKINKNIYMTNYTTVLFVVMAGIWSVMTVTYYTTYELPIFYDILFGLQGILMFFIFVCLPRPLRTVLGWLRENNYCSCCVKPAPNLPSEANGITSPPLLAGRRCIVPMEPVVDTTKLRNVKNPFMYLPE